MTSFAENQIAYPEGQLNVEIPPDTLMQNGFIPKGPGRRGQPLVANWLNWILRELFRKSNMDRLTTGAGAGVVHVDDTDCILTVYAILKSDTTKFLHAVGYKAGTAAPTFKILSNSTLTLGTTTATDIPIVGGTASDIALRVTVTKA